MEVRINMKGLLIKDFKLIMSQKKFFFMALVFAAIFANTSSDVTYAATYILILLPMLVLTTISYDDFNGGMAFLLTLPVNRKSYVREKYVLTIIDLAVSCLIALFVCILFSVIKGDSIDFMDLLLSILGTAIGIDAVLAITIPLELKYGVERGRMAMICAVAAIAVIGFGGYKLLTEVFKLDINAIVSKAAMKITDVGINVAVIVLMFILLLISYMFSNGIMKKKEF